MFSDGVFSIYFVHIIVSSQICMAIAYCLPLAPEYAYSPKMKPFDGV